MSGAGGEASSTLHVAVLSCTELGIGIAAALKEVPCVSRVTLVTSPLVPGGRGFVEKVRRIWRYEGMAGLVRSAAGRLQRRGGTHADGLAAEAQRHGNSFAHVAVPGFHTAEGLAALRELAPDLGVVFSTYILRRDVFALPRLGSINLHLGLAPVYRGSSPGFWELYHGEREVGVTVHRITERLDGGDILAQERFPLDPAPAEPRAYLVRLQREVLVPEGTRMICALLPALAAGTAAGRSQDLAGTRTFPRATAADYRELRRRIATRLSAPRG